MNIMDEFAVMDISFVIIGYNEGSYLRKCLTAIQNADLEKISSEIIYVDGGSQDDSIKIAKEVGVDRILGGDKRRRAAENRNLGFRNSKGRFIQFIDGDMVLDSSWPKHALAFLSAHEHTAAACGRIREMNQSQFFQALQIDWSETEGEVAFCGGSAMWRRDAFEAVGGFPETVAYGEEPYLCWRVRNELGLKIFYLDRLMVDHNLGYSGFGDYWRRNVRCGKTYAEIATLCYNTRDRLWSKMVVSNLVWSAVLLSAAIIFLVASLFIKSCIALLFCSILFRKTYQLLKKGKSLPVSIIYSLHVYFSKLPLAWGECLWFIRKMLVKPQKT
ncbi:MAG: glycosyltransferase [Syntrophaceae bacterium]|nr:glycosyltransferase [Syntrophaceae bacterium]